MEHFLDSAAGSVAATTRISDRALIEGKVVLEDNVRVLENAVIRGPAYVGANSVVGNNALVRDYAHIGSNSVIGYSTEVKHSYIGDECWFHSNYIGDSIIDDDCSFGSGAVTANFRLDEANVRVELDGKEVDTGYDKLGAMVGAGCRVGINAGLMPGRRVGANSFVGPHVCLTQDLAPYKKALLRPGRYEITDNPAVPEGTKRSQLLGKLKH
jgi:bifunctional UDP-N-acetylglucosamine pyrophosphorylase/glucosamine-1-phosphate N-acetyltransferase